MQISISVEFHLGSVSGHGPLLEIIHSVDLDPVTWVGGANARVRVDKRVEVVGAINHPFPCFMRVNHGYSDFIHHDHVGIVMV